MTREEIDTLDYYALLGVPRGATPDAIRAAFHRLATRHHPDRQTGDFEERTFASFVYRRGTEAYRVLMNAELRVRYDAGLDRGQIRLGSSASSTTRPPPVGGPLVTNVLARPFLQKALEAISRGDKQGAKLNLKLALQYDPGNKALSEKLSELDA